MGNDPLKCQDYSLNHTAAHHKRSVTFGLLLLKRNMSVNCESAVSSPGHGQR